MKITNLKKVKIHNYVDYVLAISTILAPWIFGLNSNSVESRIIVTIGLGIFLVNLITYHKSGLTKILRVKTHKKVDFFLGIFLCLSPFLYQFHNNVFLPHVLLGIFIVINTLFIKLPARKLKRVDLI